MQRLKSVYREVVAIKGWAEFYAYLGLKMGDVEQALTAAVAGAKKSGYLRT